MGRVSRGGGARSSARQVVIFAVLLLISSAVPVLAAEPSPPESAAPVEAEALALPGAEDVREGIETAEREEAERRRWLEGAEAVRQREESRYAFADLSAAESRELLLSTFAVELETLNNEPARFLSDAQLVRPLGEDEVAATVMEDGDGMLLDASIPVRTEDESGELRKVDLTLEPAPGGFEAVNPLSEVLIPASVDQPVEIGEKGLAVSPVDVSGESDAELLGDKNVFYPEALGPGSDADRLISPIAGGVEIFDLLRSAESPEVLRFAIELPEGAELRSDGYGGATILSGKESVASIPPPVAVDAQGTPVPVELSVEGSAVALHVPHRNADVAYPLLVDPTIQEDWYNYNWFNGHNHQALDNGSWTYEESHSWIGGSTNCIYACWGGRGLYVSMPGGGNFGGNQYGQWRYSAPNSSSFLAGAWANPFVRQDHGCPSSKYPQPHDYVGMWHNGVWNRVLNNEAINNGSNDIQSWGSTFIVGLHTGGGGYYMPCWRDLGLGGAVIWLDDWQYPVIDSVSGIVPGKWFSDKVPLSIVVKASDTGLGVRRISLHPESYAPIHDNIGGCTGLYAHRCPPAPGVKFDFTSKSLGEGIRTLNASTEDPTGKAWGPYPIGPTMVDRTSPEITLEGQLAKATDEEGSKETQDGAENLPLPVYSLTIKTTDGSTESNITKRSGVKDIRVSLDGEELAVPWQPLSECPQTSCKRDVTYSFGLSEIETAGLHKLEITAVDFASNEHVRHIEFEYFPATGMKDEYVLHYFPLPDGLGNEEEEEHPARPELAVNVMSGNLVYREQDFEVEGAAVDLEVERFYNSQLPDSESTEWGDGWTLAETPELDPEEGPAPAEAKVVESSGALDGSVELPTKVGEAEFDPNLQATITKEPDGGYELTDETGESATSVAFGEDGRAEALRTDGYAKVDYVYEEGELSEIEVEDPATFAADPNELQIDDGLVEKPTYADSFGKNGSADGQLNKPADVAIDSAGNLWAADMSNNRVQKFDSSGKFLAKFGTSGKDDGQLAGPTAIATDPQGNLWVADSGNRRVQKFDSSGKFLLKFGTQGTGNGQFSIWGPRGIAIDLQGNAWVSDYSGRIQKFDPSGKFIQAVGTQGSGKGQFGESAGLDVAPDGRIWVGDWQHNRVSVFDEAGAWLFSFGLQGTGDGQFNHPDSVEVDREGNVWVGDQSNHRVQLFDSGAKFIAKFGSFGSGPGQFAFAYAFGLETDGKGNLWVADTNNHRVQRWHVPIKAPVYESSFGTFGTGDVQLQSPADVALGLGGALWVVDRLNYRIKKFSPDGKFLFQFGKYGEGEGEFLNPASIAVDRDGNLLVLDKSARRVQKFSPEGKFILKFGSPGTSNGQLFFPEGIATDFGGDIWVCDGVNARIQRFDEEGNFIEVVGSKGSGEGQFGRCAGIDVGPDGRVWAGDWTNNRVNVFSPEGKFLFTFGSFGSGPGQFNRPSAIEVDGKGNVFVGDRENHRVQQFDSEGKYVRQFGSNGEGPGQLQLALPLGIETDPRGQLWVTDTNNHRVQRWLTAHYAPPQDEPIELSDGDPAVQVTSEASLIAAVEGNAAGEHSYEHEGDALISHDGPNGETVYEYDEEDRLTKVTLANGTWAEVEYDDHGRVKSVEVAPEGSNAKTTTFEYTDADPRRTTVTPPDAPHLVYDIGADGSVLKWWNKELPPELKLAGTLHDNKEKPEPIWNGDHWLESQAKSKEGIASIQVIANGNYLVSEETCEQDPEEKGIECTGLIIDQWVTSTDLHAPGHLQLEVIATDRIGNSSSERFWADIPEPPPPPAPGSPIPPKFRQISEFREEFGLEVVFPVKTEIELNERIFGLINAWYEGDPVAKSSAEQWGVPLRPQDIAELELREWYLDINAPLIEDWGESTYPEAYAGLYIDHSAGGVIRVGFTSDQAEHIEQLKKTQIGLVASHRLAPFSSTPIFSRATLLATESLIESAWEMDEEWDGLVVSLALDDRSNRVVVGSTNVTLAEGMVQQLLGANPPVAVNFESNAFEFSAGRNRASGRIMAGDRIFNLGLSRSCTANFGAYEKRKELRTGSWIRATFLLTAGHCFPIDSLTERSANPENINPVKIGQVTRSGFFGSSWRTDAEAIKVENGVAPREIYLDGGGSVRVESPAKAYIGDILCFSGMITNTTKCKAVVATRTVDFGFKIKMYVVAFADQDGDSGAPVWNRRTKAAVGIVSGHFKKQPNLTYVTPLLSMPHVSSTKAPGALRAPGMYSLNMMAND
jgi:tripartite motif-containing protein 71